MIGKILWYMEIKKKELIHKYLQKKYYRKAKKIGKCVRFNGISYIGSIENMEIGNNVHIGNNAFISAKGGLYIGDNTHIARNLVLYTDSHEYEGDLLPYNNKHRLKKVIIEKNVWIGINVTILPGSHIEEGAIIGAGSVVAGRVPKYAIYGASIGKVINYRNIEHYTKLEKEKKYGAENGHMIKDECL